MSISALSIIFLYAIAAAAALICTGLLVIGVSGSGQPELAVLALAVLIVVVCTYAAVASMKRASNLAFYVIPVAVLGGSQIGLTLVAFFARADLYYKSWMWAVGVALLVCAACMYGATLEQAEDAR